MGYTLCKHKAEQTIKKVIPEVYFHGITFFVVYSAKAEQRGFAKQIRVVALRIFVYLGA